MSRYILPQDVPPQTPSLHQSIVWMLAGMLWCSIIAMWAYYKGVYYGSLILPSMLGGICAGFVTPKLIYSLRTGFITFYGREMSYQFSDRPLYFVISCLFRFAIMIAGLVLCPLYMIKLAWDQEGVCNKFISQQHEPIHLAVNTGLQNAHSQPGKNLNIVLCFCTFLLIVTITHLISELKNGAIHGRTYINSKDTPIQYRVQIFLIS